MTNVPAITFTSVGYVAPTGPAVLAGVELDINAAFGNTLNFGLTTPQGQLASSWGAIIVNSNSIFVYFAQQIDPSYASGRFQDAIGRIYFLERQPSVPTALQISCNGAQGVVIPVNLLIVDTSNNLYQCVQGGTIPAAGSITLAFACTVSGPISVPAQNAVTLYQTILGLDSVSVVSGIIGKNVETRAAFEQRRKDSVAGNSFGPIGAIVGAVAKVSGVIDYFGYSNSLATPLAIFGVTIPAYSIYVSVAGGAPADVAAAIWSKKSPGAPMAGNTTLTVYDNNPLFSAPIPYQVTYQIPTPLQLIFKVILVNGPLIPPDAATQVQNALVAAVTGQSTLIPPPPRARIASVVYATSYIGSINALGPWAQVASITIGSANTPDAVVRGVMSGNTFTCDSVVSGVLAVGQNLTDPDGRILVGTYITAFAGGSGGVGAYTINQPQTVAGATFTGTGSGTNLTASAVTGSIGIGDLITGTGVPAGTTIVSQTSGTIGGAGVYVTSVTTTAAGAAIATQALIDASSPSGTSVTATAAQEPQIVSSNITVTTT